MPFLLFLFMPFVELFAHLHSNGAADLFVNRQGGASMGDGVLSIIHVPQSNAHVEQCIGLIARVADFACNGELPLVIFDGLAEIASGEIKVAEVAISARFAAPVTDLGCDDEPLFAAFARVLEFSHRKVRVAQVSQRINQERASRHSRTHCTTRLQTCWPRGFQPHNRGRR